MIEPDHATSPEVNSEAVKENNIEESAKKKAEPVTNGTHASPSKSPGKVAAPKKLGTMPSPLKSPNKPTTKTPETPSTAEKKKIPMNKIQVGAAPSPNLKTIKSKIGSLDNTSYKPGGGKIKIESRKLDFSKTQPKIEAKNPVYTPGGGDKKIQQVKLQWNAKPKVGSLDNAAHKPGGGDKKIESVKLDFKEKAKPKVGSKDNIKHVAGGGSVKIEDQKLDIKAQSKIGSLDNLKHKPGGGEKKIFDDKDYLRQMTGLANEGQSSGTQGSSRRETPVHSRTKSSESKSPGEIYKSKEELRESPANKTKSREELRESAHERIRSRDDVHSLASDRIKPTDQNSNQLSNRPEYPNPRPKEPTRKVLLNNTEDNIVKVTKEESWNRINESQPQQKTTQEERVRIPDSQPLTRNDERHPFPENKSKVTIDEKAKGSESPMPPRVIPEERSRMENQAQQRTPVEENRHRIQENQRLPSGNSPQEKSSMQQPLQYSLGTPAKLNESSSNPSTQQSANEEVLQRTPNENEIYQMPKKEMGAHSAGRGGSNPQARTPYSMYGSMHVERPGASPEVGSYYSSRLRDSNDNQHISNRAEPPPMHRVQDGNYRVLD